MSDRELHLQRTIAPPQPAFGRALAFDFSPTTRRLVAIAESQGGRAHLFVFDLDSGNVVVMAPLPPKPGELVALSPHGDLVVVPLGEQKQLAVHDVATGTERHRQATDGAAGMVDWHPAGTSFAVIAGRRIEVWDLAGGQLTRGRSLPGGRTELEWPMSVAFHPDGVHFAIGTNNPAVYIGKDGQQSRSLTPLQGAVHRLAWNATGELLAAAGFGTGGAISVWAEATVMVDQPFGAGARLVRTFPAPGQGFFERMTWDPSGQFLAVGTSSGEFTVSDVASGEIMQRFAAHPGSPTTEAHWKGDLLVTAGGWPDRTFRIWGENAGAEPAPTSGIVVRAVGPMAQQARGLFAFSLSGPDNRLLARGTARLDESGRCTFSKLPPGRYWLTIDTKADITWGATPTRVEIVCRPDSTENVVIHFG
jgi:Anaphase-promoting complex subunit 4 WD40 domain